MIDFGFMIDRPSLVLALGALLLQAPSAEAESDPCPRGEWRVHQRVEGGLDSNYVNGIVVLDDGTVVFGTNDLHPVQTHGGGVSVLSPDGTWMRHRRSPGGLQSDTVYSVAVAGDRLLAGSLKGAASVPLVDLAAADAEWRGLPSRPVMPYGLNDISDILVDARGDRWFATNAGLFVHRAVDGGWSRYGTDAEEGDLKGRFITALAEGPDGTIWIGTAGKGVAAFQPTEESWRTWTVDAGGLCNDYVYDLAVDADGRPWAGTGIGLCGWTGARWEHITSRNSPLPDDDVRAVHVDRIGRLWVGTHQGAAVIRPVSAVCAPVEISPASAPPEGAPGDGVPHRLVVSIAEGPDGRLWFGTYGGGAASFAPEAP